MILDARIDASLKRIQELLNTIPEKLLTIDQKDFDFKPSPEKWSKKEILGHLVDSAANNQQRFIRVQYETGLKIVYDQEKWNRLNDWQSYDKNQLINFWLLINQHLIHVIKNIPAENLLLTCNTGGKENVKLEFLINDYVVHMEHHLRQIFPHEIF